MMVMLLQAKNDPAADAVAAVLGDQLSVRFAISDDRRTVHLGHAVAIVVWSAQSARLGHALFEAMCRDAKRVILVESGARAPDGVLAQATRIRWDENALVALSRAISATEPRERGAGGRLWRSVARMAAGAFAAIGAFSPGVAAAQADQVAATERSWTDASAARATEAEHEVAIFQRGAAAEGVRVAPVIDLTAPVAAPAPGDAEAALLAAMLNPPTPTVIEARPLTATATATIVPLLPG